MLVEITGFANNCVDALKHQFIIGRKLVSIDFLYPLGIAKCEINPFAIPGLYIPIHFGKESQAVTDFITFKPFFGHPNMVFFSVEAHSVIIHATDKDPFETNRPICDFFNLTIKFKWYVVIAESETAACLFLALARNKLKIQILVI